MRDRALVLVGFAGAFRRSEPARINVCDLSLNKDGVVIDVRVSKTDQESAGRKVGVPFGLETDTCPVLALRRWLTEAQISAGPVFRKVGRYRAPVDCVPALDLPYNPFHQTVVGSLVTALGRKQLPIEGHRGPCRRGGVVQRAKCGHVHLLASGFFNQVIDRLQPDAAARKYLNPSTRIADEPLDEVRALWSGAPLSTGQDASHSQGNQFIQRTERIGRHVERAVEDRLPIANQVEYAPATLTIDRAVFLQNSKNDSVGARLDRVFGVAGHDFHLNARVAEPAGARTNHDYHGNAQARLGFKDCPHRRRQAPEEQCRTQLNAIRSALFRCDRIVDGPTADFDLNSAHAFTFVLHRCSFAEDKTHEPIPQCFSLPGAANNAPPVRPEDEAVLHRHSLA